jgi:hypothetical protein
MSADHSDGPGEVAPSIDRYYSELCLNIRTTDEISFKLMGAVPLVSGAGMTGLFAAGEKLALPDAAIVLVALFAALVTLGLYRWECRNIGTCKWLIHRAADLERLLPLADAKTQFAGRPDGPRFLFWEKFGKTEATRLLYGSAFLAWLAVVPIALLVGD